MTVDNGLKVGNCEGVAVGPLVGTKVLSVEGDTEGEDVGLFEHAVRSLLHSYIQVP